VVAVPAQDLFALGGIHAGSIGVAWGVFSPKRANSRRITHGG
jgi:hypothetical protein